MFKKIYYIFLFILSIISIYLGFNSTIIPNLLLYIIIGTYIISLLLILLLITRKKKLFVILGIILSIPLLIGNIAMSYLYVRSNDFFKNINDVEYEKVNYVILTLKESGYETINDLKDIGIYKNEADTNYDKAINELNKKIKLETKNYENILDLVNDLYNKKISAIFINENYLDLLEEIDEKFKDSTKVLDTITIKTKNKNTANEINLSKLENFNIYISGIDTYGPINTVSRSDVNILATIDLKNNKILLTNTPRDYYVQLANTTGLKDKLTHAGYYGIDTSIGTIENLYETKINYYIRVNFNSLVTIVDKIGGIDIYSDASIRTIDHTYINYGWNHLNGEQALAYARERHAYNDGDRHRGRNQQQVIEAIFKKITEKNDISAYLDLLSTLENSIQTNVNKKIINGLINLQVKNNYNWTFESISVDGEGSLDYTYTYPNEKLYVMIPYEDTVNNAKVKIKAIIDKN